MYNLKINIIKECDGGYTQPSAISGIRQDLFKKKVEEASIDRNSKDAGIQFRNLVEKVQDTINDFIDIADWKNVPSKVKVVILKFQNEFERLNNKYSTPPQELPIYKLWNKMTDSEQDNILNLITELERLSDEGLLVKEQFKRV